MFSIQIEVDSEKRRCHIVASGQMDSKAYIETQMADLVQNPEHFTFDRITDIRLCNGHVTYDDVLRYGNFWQTHKLRMRREISVAVVTGELFLVARLPMCNVNYPNQVMCAFPSPAEAEAWLDARLNPEGRASAEPAHPG